MVRDKNTPFHIPIRGAGPYNFLVSPSNIRPNQVQPYVIRLNCPVFNYHVLEFSNFIQILILSFDYYQNDSKNVLRDEESLVQLGLR